MTIIYFKIISI